MPDFNNTQIAFEPKSNADLRRAEILFKTIKHPGLVKILKGMANAAMAIKFPIGWAVKPTLYKQFVGGETLDDCKPTLEHLKSYGVSSIFDYSAEGGSSYEDIVRTFDEIMHSIDFAKGNNDIIYAVFKPTAMTYDEVLEKASLGTELNENERKEIEEFRERMLKLCQRAYDNDVRILVDAEDYCFQAEIDRVTENMMRKFNKKRAIVFTTLQMYRHDRLPYLRELYQDAVDNDYIIGMKFVRGAYMENERERAKKMGYEDPICKDKPATDANYNAGLEFVLHHMDRFELFSGTHNEDSNYLLARLIDENNIDRKDPRIWFAQLYGMSDHITYNLAKDGYNVTKYIPYAPVNTVLPYLIRRAEENTSMAGQTGRELTLILKEKKRRKETERNKKV